VWFVPHTLFILKIAPATTPYACCAPLCIERAWPLFCCLMKNNENDDSLLVERRDTVHTTHHFHCSRLQLLLEPISIGVCRRAAELQFRYRVELLMRPCYFYKRCISPWQECSRRINKIASIAVVSAPLPLSNIYHGSSSTLFFL
jgi:hypothetical protein